MIRWLKSLFAWRTVRDTGVWKYQLNEVNGRRRIVRVVDGGYQPVDLMWVRTGEWRTPGPPPFGATGVQRPCR